MKKYRKKPVVIEALQWTGDNLFEVESFLDGKPPNLESRKASGCWQDYVTLVENNGNTIDIKTLEGIMKASVGDYIIKDVQGEYYPCKPDIFIQIYEEMEYAKASEMDNKKDVLKRGYIKKQA